MLQYLATSTVRLADSDGHGVTVRDGGFATMELIVALFLVSIFSVSALISGQRWVEHASLQATSVRLVGDLRYAQASAVASGHSFTVLLSKYTPDYAVYDNVTRVSTQGFAAGVKYADGYLQLASGRVSYDASGNAQTSGVIRLTDDDEEADVTLYMGVGLQVLKPAGGMY